MTGSRSDELWNVVRKEKRVDRIIRWVSVTAWVSTFAVLLVYASVIFSQVAWTKKLVALGTAPQGAVWQTAMPLVIVVGLFCVLVATLSTIGVFLRFRTASLAEIQLRLAALEAMLAGRGDAANGE